MVGKKSIVCYGALEIGVLENRSLTCKRRDRTVRAAEIIKFIGAISTKEAEPDDFSEELWIVSIDHVTAYRGNTLGFTFKNGVEIMVEV